MPPRTASTSLSDPLPTILIASVLQGWALYGLHQSINKHVWPATDSGWLIALYAVAVLVPVTVELLAEHWRMVWTWLLVSIWGVALFYFGWHHGSSVADIATGRFAASGDCFPLALVLIILWLHALPFVQNRLAIGRWTTDYRLLFAHAWRNTIALAEAALFTGLFWLLLFLWQSLFHMLRIDFFRELFKEPLFAYPVTSIVFGCALYLIGSIDRLVSAVLEQILNVFKWLATVAGLLLALFTVALLLRLPDLVFTGHRAVGAVWLLWLVAVIVLLLNAAYRDGTASHPYPRWIAVSLRFVVPLTIIVSLTAAYALIVRTQHYGLTVERVWAFLVAVAALTYSIGYSSSALDKDRWLANISRVNVFVALALVILISATLTPILSPYRLAADSQYRRVLAGRFEATDRGLQARTPFHYLRFDAGGYGRRRLEQLAQLQDNPQAATIRELASQALKQTNPWQFTPGTGGAESVAKLPVFPAGKVIDADLAALLVADLRKPDPVCAFTSCPDLAGVYVDLNGDGVDEFVLLGAASGRIYQKHDAKWQFVARAYSRDPGTWPTLFSDLRKGEISTKETDWRELWIGRRRFTITSEQR